MNEFFFAGPTIIGSKAQQCEWCSSTYVLAADWLLSLMT